MRDETEAETRRERRGAISLERLKAEFEEALDALYSESSLGRASEPLFARMQGELLEAQRYPLAPRVDPKATYAAKRVRPLLLLCGAGVVAGRRALACGMQAALAVELVHSYSLVHDDLPCMDDDDYRRGRLTTHKVYGEAKALLVGDGLLPRAFEVLADLDADGMRPSRSRLASALGRSLAHAAGASSMVLGQWIDIHLTNAGIDVPQEVLFQMHVLKTGRLLGASFEMGILCGLEASLGERFHPAQAELKGLASSAREAGEGIGLAFQLIDDVLDATRSSADLGKTAGKDAAQNKATAVSLLGLEGARAFASELTQQAEAQVNEVLAHRLVQEREECQAFRAALASLLGGLLRRGA